MIGRSRLIHLAGITLAAIALAYFGREIAGLWSQSSSALWRSQVFGGMLLAILALIAGYLASAMAWREILLAMSARVSLAATLRIYFVSQFGKYLPGNVGHHAGRLALSMREKLPAPVVVASQALEMLMVVGLLAAVGLMSGASQATLWIPRRLLSMPVSAVLLLVAALAAVAALVIWLLAKTPRAARLVATLRQLVAWPRSALHLARATLLIAANLVAATCALYAIAAALGGTTSVTVAEMCFTFVVSWMAGFLTPGAPAGLGVRETVMLTLLSHSMPAAEAAATCLAFRVVTTATDLVVLLLGLCVPAGASPAGHD